MVEIKNRKDLERWLQERPREDAVTIAARAALRVAPLLVTALDEDAEVRRAAIVLPAFRATAAPWVAAVGPTQGGEIAAAGEDAFEAAANAADATRTIAAHSVAAAAANAASAAEAAYVDARIAVSYAASAAAASASAAAASGSAAAAAWEAVSADATALEQSQSPEQVAALPLWPETPPDPVAKAWPELWEHLVNANEGWEVWTDWYADRLHGRPFDKALEEARVLIDPDLWKQGPKAVNAEIKRLNDEYAVEVSANLLGSAALSADAEVITLPAKLDAALTSVELRAALADFKLDDLARLMRMVPFVEDIKHLDDPLLEKDRANKLSELVDAMAHLATDIRHDAGNAPGWLRRDLGRYSKEAERGPETVRPGHLWDIGAGLGGALKDEDIEWSLGVHLFGKLERIVEKHLDLMRDYFAATLARTRPLDQIETAPDATPEAMIDALDQAVEGLDSGDWGDTPPPDPEIPAVMADRVEELRDILDRINRTKDEEKRGDLLATFWRRGKAAAMTVMRYGVRSMELTAVGFGVAGGGQTFFPAQFQAAVDSILRLLQNIPWPF